MATMKSTARPEPDSFAGRLVALRTARFLSLSELAGQVGSSKGYLSELEHGKHSPTLDVAARLAVALGCSLDELAGMPRPDEHWQLCHTITEVTMLYACGARTVFGQKP